MNTSKRWRQHLNDLVNASLDPIVYAVQWARDPRCIRNGANHRRVGHAQMNSSVCQLWAAAPRRNWQ